MLPECFGFVVNLGVVLTLGCDRTFGFAIRRDWHAIGYPLNDDVDLGLRQLAFGRHFHILIKHGLNQETVHGIL